MKIPKLSPSSVDPAGHQSVGTGWYRLPGESYLVNPPTTSTTAMNSVEKTERSEVYEMILRGRKAVGIRMKSDNNLYVSVE